MSKPIEEMNKDIWRRTAMATGRTQKKSKNVMTPKERKEIIMISSKMVAASTVARNRACKRHSVGLVETYSYWPKKKKK